MTKEEKRAYQKAYQKAHRVERVAYLKKYNEERKAEIAAKRKAYREANKEELSSRAKAWYQANKAKVLDSVKAYRVANKEAIAARRAKYYEAHRDEAAKYYEAHRDEAAAYREAHREKAAAYREAHREKANAYAMKYSADHRAEIASKTKTWRKANHDKVLDNCALRRARKRGATVEKVRRGYVFERDGGRCHVCGKKVPKKGWHMDHLIPLSRGGEHSLLNVAASCPRCNLRKHAKPGAQLRLL